MPKKLAKHSQQLQAKSAPELKKEIKASLKAVKEIDSKTPAGVAMRALNWEKGIESAGVLSAMGHSMFAVA